MKTSKFYFLTIFLVLFFTNSYSQVTQEWVARYNGPSNDTDYPKSLFVDGAGNVYVGGGTTISGNGVDYIILKYDSAGVFQMSITYNGSGNGEDEIKSIYVDTFGNIYATGSSMGAGSGLDYVTIKYNPSGDSVWVKRYNGPGNDEDVARSIAVDDTGNVYVTGYSNGVDGEDFATVKYSPDGIQQWVARYNSYSVFSDEAFELVIDNRGFIYVTGRGGHPDDFLTIKYNASGDTLWKAWYNSPQNSADLAYSLAVDKNGNVYVTGASVGPGVNYDYTTVKYDSSGILQWASRYNGSGNGDDFSYDIAVDTNGNSYVIGYSRVNPGLYDYVTIKYAPNGDSLWVRNYDGPANSADYGYAIALDNDFNVYVAGYSKGSGSLDDYATVKYDSSGNQKWVMRYNGPQSNAVDEARWMIVDNEGNVYVTGRSFVGNYDIATVKYSQSIVGIQNISNEIPKDFNLYQNHPNPFNPSTKLKYSVPQITQVTIKVFDVLGSEITTLVNEEKQTGTYEITWYAESLQSGVYFYRLQAGSFVETKKMVLMK